MKTLMIILFFAFITAPNYLEAQILVKENRIWSTASCGTENYYWESNYIKFEGDTTINDTLFKKVYNSDDELHSEWHKYGAIREDSLKRVFLFENGAEKLLYDFSLQVGDSVESDFGGLTAYVINTEYLNLEHFDDSLKKIDLCFYKDSDWTECSWIEQIGSSHGILEGARNIGMVGAEHRYVCFSENGVLIFQNEYFNTCFPQGYLDGIESNIGETRRVNVRYSPDILLLEFENIDTQNAVIWIYNISGELVATYDINRMNRLEISNNEFSSGIYLYLFRNKIKQFTGKFIIE